MKEVKFLFEAWVLKSPNCLKSFEDIQGVDFKDIAEELGVHLKTVSRALKREEAPTKKRQRKPSKLEPYKGDRISDW